MTRNRDHKSSEPVDSSNEPTETSNDELAEVTGGFVRVVPRPVDPGLFSRFDTAELGSFDVPEIRPLEQLLHKDNDPPPPPPPPPVSVGKTGPGVGVRIGGGF
jgi:hypothetical protein